MIEQIQNHADELIAICPDIHAHPDIGFKEDSTTPGVAMAASSRFDVAIAGRGAHGALPRQSIDRVMVAVTLAQAFQTIVSRNVRPQQTAIISITEPHAGSAYNVIPDVAVPRGTIRTFDAGVCRRCRTERKAPHDG